MEPRMTVPVPDQLEYISDADGVTKDFPYPKRFLQKDEIVVLLRDEDGIDTPQILNTHYTIAGSSWPSGGTISFITAPQAPNKVVRYRMTQAKQTVDLENNQRNDAPSVETQLDRLTMAIQDRGARTDAAWFGLLAEVIARKSGDAALNSRVDQEIIDRDAGDKALASLIGQAGPIEVPLYDTAVALSFANVKSTVNAVRTGGFSDPKDKGGALYYRKAALEADAKGDVKSNSGTVRWGLVSRSVSANAFGVRSDGISLDTVFLRDAFNFSDAALSPVYLETGAAVSEQLIINAVGAISIKGQGAHQSKLKRYASSASNFINIRNSNSGLYEGFTVDNDFTNMPFGGHGFILQQSNNQRVRGVNVENVGNSDLVAGGTAMGAWPDYINGQTVRNIIFQDMHLNGDASAMNTVGSLITDGRYCYQNGIFSENFTHFATEYKEDTRYSLATDIIAYNSRIALGYGQSSAGVKGCNFNVAANIVSHECDQALAFGEATYNIFSNVLAKVDTKTSNGYGADVSTDSAGNLITGMLTHGSGMRYPVRYRGGSFRNFTSVASYDESSTIVTHDAGSTKNVTEILHPGTRTAIEGYILNNSGNPVSGTASNPTFCHATGEYLGSLSNGWKWKRGDAGASWTSYQVWKYESESSACLGLGTPGGASDIAGILISKGNNAGFAGVTYIFGSNYWAFTVAGSAVVRLSAWSIRPGTDNTMSLGEATFRYSQVYAATGTISTSDAREKEWRGGLSETELRVAKRLSKLIGIFRWKEAISRKDDAARLHAGVLAQDVISTFEAEGLDPYAYGVVCFDQWDARESISDDDGQIIEPARESGERLGIRYDELWALIAAGFEARLFDMENRTQPM